MRILYLNTPFYDFLTATLIEGLLHLRAERRLELVFREQSNYAPRAMAWGRERILRSRDRFDWVLLGTNRRVDLDLFEELRGGVRTACIDGADQSQFTHDPHRFDLYFKRELPRNVEILSHVLACPFAVERRWWSPLGGRRPLFLSACFEPREGERARLLQVLSRLPGEDVRLGPVPPPWWVGFDGVLRGQCSWSAYRRQPFAVGHNRPYHQVLRRSQLSVSVPGVGWDTGRWWEIFGSGGVVVSRVPEIRMPQPFEPSVHFVAYEDAEQLPELLEHLRFDVATVEAIRHSARRHVERYHTTRERARHVLDALDDA